jgi:tetratricopeptide (TPR) repeat protein
MNQVARAISTARFDEARAEIEAGFALGSRIQHPAANPLYWGQMFWLHRARGDADALAAAVEPLVRAGREWLSASVLRATDGMLAWAAHLQGREAEARRLYEKLAHGDFLGLPRDEHWFIMIAEAAQLSAIFDDRPRLERIAELLRPVAHRNVVHDLLRTDLGSASHFLALCERQLGNLAETIARFEAALTMNERLRAPAHLAHTRVELAATLLQRGDRGDVARATALLDQGSASAQTLGIAHLAMRARALREALP